MKPWLTALLLSLTPALSLAQDASVTLPDGAVVTLSADEAAELQRMRELDASLRYLAGEARIGDDLATLTMPRGFRYLDPAQSARVLSAWGNPAANNTLGMVFPPEGSPFSAGVWGIVLAFAPHGHVDDSDPLDVDAALASLREDAARENARRAQQGLAGFTLVGWADPPRYDRERHALWWAREVDLGGPTHRVSYATRVLTRDGALEMNVVAPITALPALREAMEGLRRGLRVHDGKRYEDFHAGSDRAATYGLTSLVAGRPLARTAPVGKSTDVGGYVLVGIAALALAGVGVAVRRRHVD